MPRLFYGIDIPNSLKSEVKTTQKRLKEDGIIADSWANSELLHVTILFLGMLDSEEMQKLLQAGKSAVKEIRPFSIWTGRFGTFAKNKILWLGFDEEKSNLTALKSLNLCLRDSLSGNLPVEFDTRPYRAHLTLARKLKEAAKLDQANPFPCTEIRVTELCLFESIRIDGVLQYPIRHRFPISE